MVADSEPKSEAFQITDFTTASEWERRISKVEEVLNDWKLIGHTLGKPLEKASGFCLHPEMILCHNTWS
jgi:Rab3 GTPase-activating protein catalytic subunit